MASVKELEAKIAQMEAVLKSAGLVPPAIEPSDPKERSDYIKPGGDRHRVFLGLEMVDDVEQALKDRFVVHTSPTTKKSYRLVDEIAAAQRGAPMEPDKAILFELRQKVSSYESGPPPPPVNAPSLAHTPIGATRIR